MEHYKSWSGLKKQLEEQLCDGLRGRITYFLTRYSDVHNAYGRAAIRLDGEEMICFSWIDMYRQESDEGRMLRENSDITDSEIRAAMKPVWDENATYSEMDFLNSALGYRSMAIQDALDSDDCIVKILAVMDRHVGRRTLQKIAQEQEYRKYPDWVRRFYDLRLKETGQRTTQ